MKKEIIALTIFAGTMLFSCGKKCEDPNSHTFGERENCETCEDNFKNGDEVKIDCGGNLCEAPCLKITNWNTANSDLQENNIFDLSKTDDGAIWLATSFGISKFDGTNFTNWNESNSAIPNNTVMSIQGYGNKVYVGNINHGLSLFDGTNWISFANNYKVNYAIICMAKYGNKVYVGTSTSGLSVFEDTTYIQTYDKSNSGIPSDDISDIEFDDSGNMWVGTTSGVAKFDGTTWTIYSTTNSNLLENYISKLKIDANNNPWVTTNKGIQRFDGTDWVLELDENASNSGFCRHDADNSMWFFSGYVDRHSGTIGGSFHEYAEEDEFINSHSAISIGSAVWVGGSHSGLFKVEYL